MASGIELDCEGVEAIVPFEQNTELKYTDTQIQKVAGYVFAAIAAMTAAGIAAMTWLGVFSITVLCAIPVALIAQSHIGNPSSSSSFTTDRELQSSIATCQSEVKNHDFPTLFDRKVLDPIHSAPLPDLKHHKESSFPMKNGRFSISAPMNHMCSKQPWLSVSAVKANSLTPLRLNAHR